MKCAIYARVSTDEQKNDMQLTELRAYAVRMGWETVEYKEKESSVKKRPVLNQLMADAKLKRFDVVIVWKIDRFARSMRQFIDLVLNLDNYGVRFVSATQNIDTSQRDPMSRFVLQLFSSLAELERGIIVERVKAGVKNYQEAYLSGRVGKSIESRSKKNLPPGRPSKVFARDRAVKLRADGMSWAQIAAAVGASPSAVRAACGALVRSPRPSCNPSNLG